MRTPPNHYKAAAPSPEGAGGGLRQSVASPSARSVGRPLNVPTEAPPGAGRWRPTAAALDKAAVHRPRPGPGPPRQGSAHILDFVSLIAASMPKFRSYDVRTNEYALKEAKVRKNRENI